MNDELIVTDEVEKFAPDFGEERFVFEKRGRKAMHGLGFGGDIAGGIDEGMIFAAGRHPVQNFEATDLDDAVALFGI